MFWSINHDEVGEYTSENGHEALEDEDPSGGRGRALEGFGVRVFGDGERRDLPPSTIVAYTIHESDGTFETVRGVWSREEEKGCARNQLRR